MNVTGLEVFLTDLGIGRWVILSSERCSLNKCTSSIFSRNLLMIQTLLCS